jgi:hypothetical protein
VLDAVRNADQYVGIQREPATRLLERAQYLLEHPEAGENIFRSPAVANAAWAP